MDKATSQNLLQITAWHGDMEQAGELLAHSKAITPHYLVPGDLGAAAVPYQPNGSNPRQRLLLVQPLGIWVDEGGSVLSGSTRATPVNDCSPAKLELASGTDEEMATCAGSPNMTHGIPVPANTTPWAPTPPVIPPTRPDTTAPLPAHRPSLALPQLPLPEAVPVPFRPRSYDLATMRASQQPNEPPSPYSHTLLHCHRGPDSDPARQLQHAFEGGLISGNALAPPPHNPATFYASDGMAARVALSLPCGVPPRTAPSQLRTYMEEARGALPLPQLPSSLSMGPLDPLSSAVQFAALGCPTAASSHTSSHSDGSSQPTTRTLRSGPSSATVPDPAAAPPLDDGPDSAVEVYGQWSRGDEVALDSPCAVLFPVLSPRSRVPGSPGSAAPAAPLGAGSWAPGCPEVDCSGPHALRQVASLRPGVLSHQLPQPQRAATWTGNCESRWPALSAPGTAGLRDGTPQQQLQQDQLQQSQQQQQQIQVQVHHQLQRQQRQLQPPPRSSQWADGGAEVWQAAFGEPAPDLRAGGDGALLQLAASGLRTSAKAVRPSLQLATAAEWLPRPPTMPGEQRAHLVRCDLSMDGGPHLF